MRKIRVMMVGSAEESKGGVSTVLKTMQKMSFWKEYSCYWLGTQIQGSYLLKIKYCIIAYIIALLKIWNYDIIHFHTVPDRICLIIQMPIFLLSLLGRKKIIMHIHMGNQLKDHTKNKLFLWCLKHSNLIILLAKKWENKFSSWYPQISTPITTLYNAYEPVRAIDYSLREPTIIFAAHLNSNKAYDILLKAFKRIYNKHSNWSIIILGDGEVEQAKQMSEKLHINQRVLFTGYIVGKKKVSYFQKASIFCMCSYQEGFPMVVMEAWSFGIPVITTPVGGLPDVLEDNKNACIFPFGDDEELARKLDFLIENTNQREYMSKYSIDFVEKHFSIDIINQQIKNKYELLQAQ